MLRYTYVACLLYIRQFISDLTNCVMVGNRPVTTEARFRSRTSSSETFDVQCSTRPFFVIQVILLPYVSIISPVLRTRLHAQVPLTRRTNGRCLGIIQNAVIFRVLEKIVSKCTVILSIPQSMWDFLWIKQHLDKFFSKLSCFALSVSFHRCSISIFVLTLLLIRRTSERSLGKSKCRILTHIGEWWTESSST